MRAKVVYVGALLASVIVCYPSKSDAQVSPAADPNLLRQEHEPVVARRALESPPTNTLVDGNGDLAFFSVTPCRLFDSRLAGGMLVAGTSRTLAISGDLSGQGGAPSCGVPTDSVAVVVTLTAVTPMGNGHIRAWAAGDPQVPLASAVNYGPSMDAVANTTVIPVCQGCGGHEIQVQAFGADVHAVGDVVGYFLNPRLPSVYTVTFERPNVLPTTAGVNVLLTGIAFTPVRTGTVLARATGSCAIVGGPGDDQVVIGVAGAVNHPPSQQAVIRIPAAFPDVTYQPTWAIEDVVSVQAGVGTIVSLEAGRLLVPGPGITGDCFGRMTIEETFVDTSLVH